MKALFLDRDGVVNVDHGYVGKVEDFQFVDGILDCIRRFQKKGFQPIVVTNQSGIGRGYYTLEDFENVTDFMLRTMREHGIEIDRSHVFFCPHAPDAGCDCRKPNPGMFLQAKKRFDIDMPHSIMIGDKPSDIEAAKAAGVGKTILVTKNEPIDCDILL